MPKGVYDRSKIKRNKKPGPKPAAEKTAAPTDGRKKRGRRKAVEKTAAPAKTVTAQSTGRGDIDAFGQFEIVRQNLITLGQVRSHLKPDESTDALDEEMTKQLTLMGTLREFHFGGAQEIVPAEEETAAPPPSAPAPAPAPVAQAVPLPPPPNIPVPQIPTQPQ